MFLNLHSKRIQRGRVSIARRSSKGGFCANARPFFWAVVLIVVLIFVGVHLNWSPTDRWDVKADVPAVVVQHSQQPAYNVHRFGATHPPPPVTCTALTTCLGSTGSTSEFLDDTVYTCNDECSAHATCFLGTCMCHPGYDGPTCENKMTVANPWYTADCPNLKDENTLDITRIDVGGVEGCPNGLIQKASMGTGLSYCAYLCYSNVDYGTAIIPVHIWKKAQQAEDSLWRNNREDNDRFEDHFEGFANYACIPENLGHVAEYGAGPWTQFRGLLHLRPHTVERFTIIEPGADFYTKNVPTCAYKTGKLEKYKISGEFYDFPLTVQSKLGEQTTTSHRHAFDTIMVSNVIEHVQNAVEFLHGIHHSLTPGGLLIFHDRYYETPESGDAVLGRNVYHPIRLTRTFFDHFLSDFDIIFNNCDGHKTIRGWKMRNAGERGYYVVARKKLKKKI
jgi:SAM-dependent methyltransferase